MVDRYKSDTQIVQELEELRVSLDRQPRVGNRRNASLVLPRTSVNLEPAAAADRESGGQRYGRQAVNPKPRARRMSLSPWRTRGKPEVEEGGQGEERVESVAQQSKWSDEVQPEKKGIWNWKPIRALSHIAMQKLNCLFSVEVVAAQSLPPSMNGLRLAACVRKKESKDGAVQTMPSRVSDGAADFEETLFIRCHVYFTPGAGNHTKFEPRPFLIYLLAVDAPELDFGRSSVDLSGLIQESLKKSSEGTRIRQWDTAFRLSGKAKGGEIVLKLGFQIMEKDGGLEIFRQAEGRKPADRAARSQSRTSFSISSPMAGALSPSYLKPDDANFDEPAASESSNSKNLEEKVEEIDFPEFDVVDKGVEIEVKARPEEEEEEEEQQSEENSSDKRSVSSEVVVKEVVHDHDQEQIHSRRLSELDSIAKQIKALEFVMGEKVESIAEAEEETQPQVLDADEDKVTREFLQLLEDDNDQGKELGNLDFIYDKDEDAETEVFLSDLGKGLGCVVQTRNGGFLAAMNPLETPVARKDTPKLAMQLSKPVVIASEKASGFEAFQKMASLGLPELSSEILSLMPIDELVGKTAEQVAFEGIASAIILGRNKEGATSTAARTVGAVKSMANAIASGRKERIATGIWNVSEDPLTAEEILPFSMQKIESMAMEALKIQADATEEEAPFHVSPSGKLSDNIFAAAVPVDDWIKESSNNKDESNITISVVVQLRDPLRQFEAVGGPLIALIQVTAGGEEGKYKVKSLQVGGVKVGTPGAKNSWDGEKQRLTALQWLVACGLMKAGKKGKRPPAKGSDVLWSLSARVMADMWLKPIRNPDVKFSQ